MRLLGHKDIRMTLRYVIVTLVDLQRQFHLAHRNKLQSHQIPITGDKFPRKEEPGVTAGWGTNFAAFCPHGQHYSPPLMMQDLQTFVPAGVNRTD
jgi:hypothetical protein